MADYAEEIAKRLADRRARRRYWPEGEPDSRRERDRGKRRGKSDPSEMKASYDPKFKGKPKAEPEKLESISEFVKKERTRRLERALKTMEERRVVPKDVPLKKWLSQPGNLDRALKRGMVRMIARHANPKSKDTDDVVTVGGRRYAKTDLYKAPLREKASEIVLKTKYGSEMWWDRNKKAIFVASVSLVAGFMIYSAWKNAQLEKGLAKQRTRRRGPATHAGLLAMPAHHWHRPRYFSGPNLLFSTAASLIVLGIGVRLGADGTLGTSQVHTAEGVEVRVTGAVVAQATGAVEARAAAGAARCNPFTVRAEAV